MTRTKIRLAANLAATWIGYCEDTGMTRADALRHLNAATGSKTTHSRLNEWLRGDREPIRPVRQAMLQMLLPAALADFGVTLKPDHYSDLAEALL